MRPFAFRLLVAGLGACAMGFCGVAAATAQQPPAADKPPVDLVVVIKSQRVMYLYVDGLPVKSFDIGLGDRPVGDKRREGDERTPEGAYILDWRNLDSHYYRSIHISYPNARDVAWARAHGVDPGGNIMIHGLPNDMDKPRHWYLTHDWTFGCIAVSNSAMQWIWMLVKPGTPIVIKP